MAAADRDGLILQAADVRRLAAADAPRDARHCSRSEVVAGSFLDRAFAVASTVNSPRRRLVMRETDAGADVRHEAAASVEIVVEIGQHNSAAEVEFGIAEEVTALAVERTLDL